MCRRTMMVAVGMGLLWVVGCGPSVEEEPESIDPPEENQTCTVPGGTYTREFADAGGSCPQELVEDFTSLKEDVEVESGTECGTNTNTIMDTTDEGCEVTLELSVDTTSTGPENGQATVEVVCESGECTHDFNVYWTKR